MVRTARTAIIRSMTTITGRRRIRITRCVTGRTLVFYHCVRTSQHIIIVVVKRRGYPRCLTVTLRTARRKTRLSMVRIGRPVVIRSMTTITGSWRIRIARSVTGCALVFNHSMRTSQDIVPVVIKSRGRPPWISGMTGSTINRKSKLTVVRISRTGIITDVTRITICWGIRIAS